MAEELSVPRHIQPVMRGLRADNAQFQGVTGQKKMMQIIAGIGFTEGSEDNEERD